MDVQRKVFSDIANSIEWSSVQKSFLLKNIMSAFLENRGVKCSSFVINIEQGKSPGYVIEAIKKQRIFFLEEDGIEEGEDGAVFSQYSVVIPGSHSVCTFSSDNGEIFSYKEFFNFKQKYLISENDPALSFFPATFLALEIFSKISQKKITDISIFLKKISEMVNSDIETSESWLLISHSYLLSLLFYSFELSIKDLSSLIESSSVKNQLIDIINENGSYFEIIKMAEKYVSDPTSECREKNRLLKEAKKNKIKPSTPKYLDILDKLLSNKFIEKILDGVDMAMRYVKRVLNN